MLDNNTDDDSNLKGKYMRYLQDRECNNGKNHTTQKDCRAKVPISVSETTVQVGKHAKLAVTI